MIDDFLPSKAPKKHHAKIQNSPKPLAPIRDEVDIEIRPSAIEKLEIPKPEISYDSMKETPRPRRASSKSHWYSLHWPFRKKEWIIILFILLLSGLGTFLFLHYKGNNGDIKTAKIKVSVYIKPKTVASRLSGVQVSPQLAALPVTGVMIENSDAARPQSGLSDAGVVFEAIAEGGVTRFLALYEENQPSSIGPIRSARPFYVHALLPFDAAYAHVGGSADGLSEITSLNVKDMNQFYNGSSYTRIASRQAPHNVYASMSGLLSLEASKGWKSSNFKGFPRKKDQPAKTPTVNKIDMAISGPDYNVHYDYSTKLNAYLRSEGGAAQNDANTNAQLTPKVVIGLVVPWNYGALDATGAYYTNYTDVGSGIAYIFQDGGLTTGTWTKSSPASQITFTDASGKAIALNAGQTWITAVGKSSNVTYGP